MIVIMYILHLIFIKNVVKAKWEISLFHLILVIIILFGDLEAKYNPLIGKDPKIFWYQKWKLDFILHEYFATPKANNKIRNDCPKHLSKDFVLIGRYDSKLEISEWISVRKNWILQFPLI